MILEAPLVMARSSYCKNVHARLAYDLGWLLQIHCISPSTIAGSLSRKTRRQLNSGMGYVSGQQSGSVTERAKL